MLTYANATVWHLADGSQRAGLMAAIFERIEADTTPERQIKLVAVPRPGWKSFFEGVLLERETGLELSVVSKSSAARIRRHSRAAYGRPRQLVEDEIRNRLHLQERANWANEALPRPPPEGSLGGSS